jgi:hypothetical protein
MLEDTRRMKADSFATLVRPAMTSGLTLFEQLPQDRFSAVYITSGIMQHVMYLGV